MEQTYFQWPEYLVVAIMLLLSAAIGFYYACTGDKQQTTKEYLLADGRMHWFPVGCSLLASFVSSNSLLGLPGEIYTFGTVILLKSVCSIISVTIAACIYLPVTKGLGAISVFKYMELRFGKPLKYMAVICMLISSMAYTSFTIYGPALSISAVTGVNIWLAVFTTAGIAILYTVLGGLKAVLWTDTVQLIIMVTGVMFVAIFGTAAAGGIGEVWEVNKLSGRLDFLEAEKVLDSDPRMRHTIWSLFIGTCLLYCNAYGVSQVAVQRAMSLKSNKDIILAYGMTAIGTSFFGFMCGFLGLLVFAHYKLCDPIEDGFITSKDQLYPLYVMRLLGHYPGLPGLILSSVFSGSLSTISSNINSSAANILQDFVRPFKPNLPDKRAVVVTKIISLVFGSCAVVLVLFAKYFGRGLFSISMTIAGVFGGPVLAIFTVGIFFPTVNHASAVIGFLSGSACSSLIGFGGLFMRAYVYQYPTGTVGCNITDSAVLANLSSPVYDPNTWDPHSHYRPGFQGVFDISYLWAGPSALFVAVVVSLLASLCLAKNEDELIDPCLLSPLLLKNCCFMPESWRKRIDFGKTKDESDETPKDMDITATDGKSLAAETSGTANVTEATEF